MNRLDPLQLAGAPILVTDEPPIPTANTLAMYARNFGRMMIGSRGPGGDSITMQPHIGRNRIQRWQAVGNSNVSPFLDNWPVVAATGQAATARPWAATSPVTRSRRIGYVTTATAGNLSGVYAATGNTVTTGALYTGAGGNSPMGGFQLVMTFGVAFPTVVPAARFFLGLSNATAASTNTDIRAYQNGIGIGKPDNSNNLHVFSAGSAVATAATMIDLGANFPATRNSLDLYTAVFYCPPGLDNIIYYYVQNLSTGIATFGSITGTAGTNFPANTIGLGPRWVVTNNTAASIVGIDVSGMYLETDF